MMRLSIPPSSSPPTSAEVNHAVTYLRAELGTCTDQTQLALLHYDLALVFEQARDDHSAAKELLAAVNAHATLREPLEHLIALIERRRSHVNLGKLLDRLARISDSREESIRAQLARGNFLTDYRSDFPAATQAYQHVLELDEGHGLAWLALHYVGARQSDAKLVERALHARIRTAQEQAYGDALRLQLARFQTMRGRHDLARATLSPAAAPGSPLRLPALVQQELLIASPTDYAARAEVLEQQAVTVSSTLEDTSGSSSAVPASKLNREVAADAWLRAALNLEANDPTAPNVLTFLDNALKFCGPHPVLTRARMRQLTRLGMTESRRAAIRELLADADEAEPYTTTLWLDVARDALQASDNDHALHALRQALRNSPHSLTARALWFEILWGQGMFDDLGRAYEAIAELVDSNAARSRNYLLAATAYAFSAESPTAPRAALTLAAAAGANYTSVVRLSKFLADLRKDSEWATEALTNQASSAEQADRISAMLELSRRAVLSGDSTEATRCFTSLSSIPQAQSLGWVLLAYGPWANTRTTTRTAVLHGLAASIHGETSIALQQVIAGEHVKSGQWLEARAVLDSVHRQHPAHTPVAAQLSQLLHHNGDIVAAVRVLTETASAVDDISLTEALHLQAGIRAWQAQAPALALQSFEAATSNPDSVSGNLLHWAWRSAQPDDPAARRRALEMSLSGAAAEDNNAYALERFALEVGFSSQHNEAADALNSADELPLDEIGEAVQLARALYPQATHHQEAVRYLQNHSSVGKELVAATSYYKARAELAVPVDSLLALARRWADQGSLPAALEWFSLAVTTCNREQEAAARLAIAPHLPEQAAATMRASVALLRHLSGDAATFENVALLENTTGKQIVAGSDDGAVTRLINAELAHPGAAPSERARALEAIAPLYDASISDDNHLTLLTLAAHNWLACGRYEQALVLFRQIIEAEPSDIASWYGVADCAKALDLPWEQAVAQEQVGSLHLDPKQAAVALREAARLYLEVLGDEDAGNRCLGMAVGLDIGDFASFDRWFRHLRKQGEREQLIALCTARLNVADNPKELTRLHWERSRAFRHLDRLEEALADLDTVRLLDPEHIGARALASEIFISLHNYSRAAAELSQLAAMAHAPADQRHLSALAAVDLYETQLDDVDSALRVLNSMKGVPGDHLLLKERLAKALARASRWDDAVQLLGELSNERRTQKERAQAARLRLAILRDKLNLPELALDAVKSLLRNNPGDDEALDLVLEGHFDEADISILLREQVPVLLRINARDLEAESAARLARVAEELDDLDLRLLALSTLVCVGSPSNEVLTELQMLQARCAAYPRMTIDGATVETLIAADDSGPLLEIMRVLAPHLPDILGPTLKSLGVGRRERKRALELLDVKAEVAAWAGAFALDDIEVFIGGAEPNRLSVLADGNHGSIVIGGDIKPPFSPAERAALAAKVLGLKRGTSIVLDRDPVEVAALLVAACRVAGAALPSAPFALTGEFERLLQRELPRRVRRALEPIAASAAAQMPDPLHYVHCARATLDRAAAVAAGDVSFVLLSSTQRLEPIRNLDAAALQRQRHLLEFCLSPEYLHVRQQLGMSAQ